MRGNWNSRTFLKAVLPLQLLIVASCVFLTGCPNVHLGRQFLYGGTFNIAYFNYCEELERSKTASPARMIQAYSCLLYMDAGVAGDAVKGIATVRPEYGVISSPGVDKGVAFQAFQKLIPLYISQKEWRGLLHMLSQHQNLLRFAYKYEILESVVVALEQLREHGQDAGQIREVADTVASQLEAIPQVDQDATRHESLSIRIARLREKTIK